MPDIMSFRNVEMRDGPCPSSRFTAVGNPIPPAWTAVEVVNQTEEYVERRTHQSGQ